MAQVPKYIEEGLEKQGPETLRTIARMAESLADRKEEQRRADLEEQAIDEADQPDDIPDPDDAPGKAYLTTKTIDDNDYYYWQWRDGDQVKSEYVRPVNPKQ